MLDVVPWNCAECQTPSSLSGSGYGSGRISTLLTTQKTAVVAPMPSASVSTDGQGKARCASERPDGVTHIAEERIERLRDIHVSRSFALDDRVAELEPGVALRLVVVQSFGAELVTAFGEMKGQLTIEVAIVSPGCERCSRDGAARTWSTPRAVLAWDVRMSARAAGISAAIEATVTTTTMTPVSVAGSAGVTP